MRRRREPSGRTGRQFSLRTGERSTARHLPSGSRTTHRGRRVWTIYMQRGCRRIAAKRLPSARICQPRKHCLRTSTHKRDRLIYHAIFMQVPRTHRLRWSRRIKTGRKLPVLLSPPEPMRTMSNPAAEHAWRPQPPWARPSMAACRACASLRIAPHGLPLTARLALFRQDICGGDARPLPRARFPTAAPLLGHGNRLHRVESVCRRDPLEGALSCARHRPRRIGGRAVRAALRRIAVSLQRGGRPLDRHPALSRDLGPHRAQPTSLCSPDTPCR